METRDTILRLIEQTALILRAFFNSLPLKDKGEFTHADFSSNLKTQTALDLDLLLAVKTSKGLQEYVDLHPSFNAENQELLADLLVVAATQQKETNPEKKIAYQHLALHLYQGVNQTTQTYEASRQEKIKALQAVL